MKISPLKPAKNGGILESQRETPKGRTLFDSNILERRRQPPDKTSDHIDIPETTIS